MRNIPSNHPLSVAFEALRLSICYEHLIIRRRFMFCLIAFFDLMLQEALTACCAATTLWYVTGCRLG